MRGGARSGTSADSPAPKSVADTQRLKGAQKQDGIVLLSGLRFQQCTAGQDSTLRVCTGDAVSMNHFRADDYCRRLSLGNQRWRLPTRSELKSILLTGQDFAPLTDPDVFPGTKPMMYWTGDPFHGANSAFWTVDFLDGRTRGEEIFKNAYVRCVSGS